MLCFRTDPPRTPELLWPAKWYASNVCGAHLANEIAPKPSDAHMHVFFGSDGRPFILDSQMRWDAGVNAYLARLSVIDGSTKFTKNLEKLRL